MKKILSLLIALAIVLSIGVLNATPVSADAGNADYYGSMDGSNEYGSGQIEVTHRAYSSFQLEIPLYADSMMPNTITAYYPNLEDGYQIEIYVTNLNEDGTLNMTHSSGEVSTMVLYNVNDCLHLSYQNPLLASFAMEDFNNTYSASSEFYIQQGENFNMKAGTHTGVICYRIECNPISQ